MSGASDRPGALPPLGPGAPTPPTPLAGGAAAARAHLRAGRATVPDGFEARLATVCESVTAAAADVAEASRDWWPISFVWAAHGEVPALAHLVARPGDGAQVAAVLRLCHAEGVPVTAAGGRSGVCGASVPVHGGVVLDTTALAGIVDVDRVSLVADVGAGTFGDHLEHELRTSYAATLGHWPQSVALSTVGGWLACRSAGQLSTRYGKIEDMVLGLDVALADGTLIRTGGAPRAAAGPDLTALFVGSEGTLGVITGARLRLHPAPTATRAGAYRFDSFAPGLEAVRAALARGATPAVARLYDEEESRRSHGVDAGAVLLVLDEGDPVFVDATFGVVDHEARAGGGTPDDPALTERWLAHRNDTSALGALTAKGFVVDTMEVAAPWRDLGRVYGAVRESALGVPGTVAATAHCSHSYTSGACLYFSLAGRPPDDGKDGWYRAVWDAAQGAALAAGANLSHHHGVGLHRSRFVAAALGDAYGVLVAAKRALDPRGILNPGKLGLPSPFGAVAWP